MDRPQGGRDANSDRARDAASNRTPATMINTAMFPRVLPALLGAVLALLPCAYGRDLVSQTQFDQRLGEPLPLHAQFRDEAGTPVPLATYFTTRPVILVLTYFACNNLCGTMLSALTTRLARIDLIAG